MSPPDFHDHSREPVGLASLAPSTPIEAPPLVVHGDPSRPGPVWASTALPTSSASRPHVSWVRPSELPTLVGRELLGRVTELQSAFARGAWRAPVKVVRAARDQVAARTAPNLDFDPPPRQSLTRDVGGGGDPMDQVDPTDPTLVGPHDEGVQLA